MDIDIRRAILHNVKENSENELKATIIDAIENGEEKLLPGLGVLFELIWKEANENEQLMMLHSLKSGIETAQTIN